MRHMRLMALFTCSRSPLPSAGSSQCPTERASECCHARQGTVATQVYRPKLISCQKPLLVAPHALFGQNGSMLIGLPDQGVTLTGDLNAPVISNNTTRKIVG
jgi:hypothetical protein